MKKLLIASMTAALASSVWADFSATAESFEGAAVGTTLTTGTGSGWAEFTGESVSATITAYGDATSYTYGSPEANKRAETFGSNQANYLALESDIGSPLLRHFDTDGAAVGISDGYVLDTLVQFTGGDETPVVDKTTDKFVVWLKSDDDASTAKLMVTCGSYDGSATFTTSNVELSTDVAAGSWARVSVKAIQAVTTSGMEALGFVVYVNGVAVTSDSVPTLWGSGGYDSYLTTAAKALVDAKMLFPSIQFDGTLTAKIELTSVGFEGMGAIDDLQIVTAANAPSFTKDGSVVVNYEVSFAAVGLAEGASWSKDSETIESGKTLTQPEEPSVTGYTFKGWFSDEECANAITFPLTIEKNTTIYAQFEAEAAVDPVAPGDTVAGASEVAAKAALEKAGIATPYKGMSDELKKAYAAMFEATATGEGTSWTATWTLKEESVTTLKKSADDALATALDGVLGGETSVSITAEPGFYYAVLSADAVNAEEYTASTWTMAEGVSVNLTLPEKSDTATQGFYKVGVSAVKPDEGEE